MSAVPLTPDDIAELGACAATVMRPRVQERQWQGRRVWIKRAARPAKTGKRLLQAAMRLALPQPLRPGVIHSGAEGLRHERAQAAAFAQNGFVIPAVIHAQDAHTQDCWMAMEDLGRNAEECVEESLDAPRARETVNTVARMVAQMHIAGLRHGRAKLNDFVVLPDGRIGVIDFEEDVSSFSAAAVHAREILMFVFSICRFEEKYPGLCRDAVNAYCAVRGLDRDDLAQLKSICRWLSPLRMLTPARAAKMGKDVVRLKGAVSVLLENMPGLGA